MGLEAGRLADSLRRNASFAYSGGAKTYVPPRRAAETKPKFQPLAKCPFVGQIELGLMLRAA
jgi:hypothetical protein